MAAAGLLRPLETDEPHNPRFKRVQSNCEVNQEAFANSTSKKLAMQYGDLYYVRLNTLRKNVTAQLRAKHGDIKLVPKVLDCLPDERCAVIGTLYKEMKLKPSVLDEYSKDFNSAAQHAANYTSDDDKVVLEDESGRINLYGETVPVGDLCTGIVIAVVGKETEEGFLVEELIFPSMPAQTPLPSTKKDSFVLIVSGLGIGGANVKAVELQMLADFASGNLGDSEDQSTASQIAAVIFAGNSVALPSDDAKKSHVGRMAGPEGVANPMKEFDVLVCQCAASVPTFVMPGESDPSGFFLPQQPLHQCLLPTSHTFSTFTSLTNPTSLSVNSVKFVGTSGQNISDLVRQSKIQSRIEALEHTIEWGVMAPTAPDTLGCYPFMDEDPFLFSDCPHIYFAGNQNQFETKLHKGREGQNIRIVSVPKFSETGTAAMVNLRTLECEAVAFSIDI